ncbi:uncharacterized protein [Halyomorpha halys]|uniref:uncharacterized protein isoform X2 n=1 Tax=Halyomorpha halys TaxID=286706 RepID=UPI0034D28F21
MFDTEAFIREVMKRPALYSSRARESGDSKIAYWEEIGQVIYKEWPSLNRPEQRMERIRELRKKWKSVRDNFLRDMKSPGSRKKRYVYHDLMTFLIPHLDPRRWHSGEEDGSDGDYRPVKRKQPVDSGNREFLMSLAPLLDDMTQEDVARVRQEVIWTVEAITQAGRERRVISTMAETPALWSSASANDPTLWLHLAHDARMSVEECKKIWAELVTDFKNHLEQGTPREKWKYEDEMSFFIPYISGEDNNEIGNIFPKMKIETNEDEDEEDGAKLPVELCQVECPPSPSEISTDLVSDMGPPRKSGAIFKYSFDLGGVIFIIKSIIQSKIYNKNK